MNLIIISIYRKDGRINKQKRPKVVKLTEEGILQYVLREVEEPRVV